MSCINKYNVMNQIAIKYDQLAKLMEEASSFCFKFELNEIPKYFKKRNTGVISGWFNNDEKNHTITFPAYKDVWNNIWVIVNHPLRITDDPDDFAWEFFDHIVIDLIGEI